MRLIAQRDIQDYIGIIPRDAVFEQSDEARAEEWLKHGIARRADATPDALPWASRHSVIMASGPSLSDAQCDAVRAWRDADPSRRLAMVINTTFRMAPWADVLYACDMRWWQRYAEEAFASFGGELWTQDEQAKRRFERLNLIKSARGAGASKKRGVIHQGGGAAGPGNGGYQAIELAFQRGCTKITLVGFDMRLGPRGEKHHHGDHPGHMNMRLPFKQWIGAFDDLSRDLAHVDVVNCTPGSALTAFPAATLEDRLGA